MNRGSDSILSVYSDARAEYTKQLCIFLVPAYFQFFTELLEKAKQEMAVQPKKALWQFQTYLNEIHDWNIQKVNSEINVIHTNCGCDYLEDLLTAVFIAHTKVLTAIRLSSNNKKIEVNIPKVEHFLFKVLCETSKLLWSSTYLFRDGISGIEKQQNYRNIEQLINEGILQAVRGLIPVKTILKDFIYNDPNSTAGDNEDDDSDDDEQEHEKVKEHEHHHTHMQEKDTEPSHNNEETHSVDNTDKPNSESAASDITLESNISVPEQPVSILQSDVPFSPEVNLPEVNNTPVQLITSEQPVHHVQQSAPTIIIDDKPSVRFGEFDAVFDSDHPMDSDMIYEPKDEDGEDDVPVLDILEGAGTSLSAGLDFDSLDNTDNSDASDEIKADDYEEL